MDLICTGFCLLVCLGAIGLGLYRKMLAVWEAAREEL